MKRSTLTLRVGAIFGAVLFPAHGQGPVLTTPGTATWESFDTSTGTRTVFTIRDDSIFSWGGFHLPAGDELVFSFSGGDSVVNQLQGSGVHILDGTVTGIGGSVGFFSPDGDLLVNGSITAGSVTLATTDVDPAAFASGGAFALSGGSGFNVLTVNGSVTATAGDVVLAGRFIDVGGSAVIEASDAVRYAAGEEISVSGSGDEQLEVSGIGHITHLGRTHASRIEMKAGGSITTRGELGIGNNRLFIEVGPGGTLRNEAVVVGDAAFDEAIVALTHEKDLPPVQNDAELAVHRLERPGGEKVAPERVVRYTAPTSASSDATRDTRRSQQRTVAKRGDARPPLLRRSSFFAQRGGDRKAR